MTLAKPSSVWLQIVALAKVVLANVCATAEDAHNKRGRREVYMVLGIRDGLVKMCWSGDVLEG